MGDEANSERHRRERAVRLIEHGTDLTGPLAGAGVGMLGGPLGALAGAAVGAAVQKVLIRVGDEFAQRQLGPREQTRAGAALYFALTDIEERLKAGDASRSAGDDPLQ